MLQKSRHTLKSNLNKKILPVGCLLYKHRLDIPGLCTRVVYVCAPAGSRGVVVEKGLWVLLTYHGQVKIAHIYILQNKSRQGRSRMRQEHPRDMGR